jgi:hypothetical protein
MTAEMTARGIDCHGAPPAWAWPGWASPKQALYTAALLLGFDQWAHGVVMLRLAVPDDQILCTSYAAWNDFLGPTVNRDGQPATMDFRGVLLSKYDNLQTTIPQIKARWVRRARPMTMSRYTRRQILRDPNLRHMLIPARADGSLVRRGDAALVAVLGVLAAIDTMSTATGGIFANLVFGAGLVLWTVVTRVLTLRSNT